MKQRTKFKETEIGKIPEDWEIEYLDSLCEISSSKRIFLKEYANEGIPFYRSKEIILLSQNQEINAPLFISKEKFDEISLKYGAPKEGDLLMTSVGTLGVPYIIRKNQIFYFKDGNLMWFKSFEDRLLNKYLYYWVKSPLGQQRLDSIAIGSTQKALTIDSLKRTELLLPSLYEQKSISKILSDLDSKIEINIEMNKTLESLVQAIFKRWFVDFEFPFDFAQGKPNEKGKPYMSSGGKMVDSELGKIPEGWTVSNLGDGGTFKNGINYLRDETGDTDFFIANVRDIANNKLLLKESLDKIQINLSKAKEYLLQEKDILIARSASPGEISLVLGDLEKVIYSGFSIRYRLSNPNNYLFIFHIMQGLKTNLQNYSIGTTLQSVNQETLKNMKFILPSDETLKEFNKISKQMLNKTLSNLQQNRELSQIRDSLLPRLMSGKIRVV